MGAFCDNMAQSNPRFALLPSKADARPTRLQRSNGRLLHSMDCYYVPPRAYWISSSLVSGSVWQVRQLTCKGEALVDERLCALRALLEGNRQVSGRALASGVLGEGLREGAHRDVFPGPRSNPVLLQQ